MQIKLKELVVKRKNGAVEVDFVEFLVNFMSQAANRAHLKKMIETQEQYNEAWLDHELSRIFMEGIK